ncbi:hypothetical protein, partial [Limnospira sp. PMC 1245.20]
TVTNNTEPGFKNAIFAYNDVDELILNCNEFVNPFICVHLHDANLTTNIGEATPGIGANNIFDLVDYLAGLWP